MPRLFSPSAARNREPILGVLRAHLPAEGVALEIASGSGEHIVHFARALPRFMFQPSDPDSEARASIDAWIDHECVRNVRHALALDVTAPTPWPLADLQVVLCINMIHISPWSATVGLMRGAAASLVPGGLLFLYGPYKRGGRHTAPSNAAFDASLAQRDPDWGVRDLEAVTGEADRVGLGLEGIVEMPANNFSILLRARRG